MSGRMNGWMKMVKGRQNRRCLLFVGGLEGRLGFHPSAAREESFHFDSSVPPGVFRLSHCPSIHSLLHSFIHLCIDICVVCGCVCVSQELSPWVCRALLEEFVKYILYNREQISW